MTTLDMTTALPLGRAQPKTATKRGETNPQFLGRLTGILFLITFITSIPPVLSLYVPVLSDPAYITGSGSSSGLSWGVILELLLIVANIGSAIALFPIAKRQNEGLALGFVASRLMESAFIGMGIVALLAIGSLRLGATGAESGAMIVVGKALVAVHDWTFRLGPGVVVGVGNGLILGTLMWRSRLVPRPLAILGLIGGPLILASGAAVVLGAIQGLSMWQGIATVPEFFWELGFGLWLTVKGFNPTALAALMARSEDAASS